MKWTTLVTLYVLKTFPAIIFWYMVFFFFNTFNVDSQIHYSFALSLEIQLQCSKHWCMCISVCISLCMCTNVSAPPPTGPQRYAVNDIPVRLTHSSLRFSFSFFFFIRMMHWPLSSALSTYIVSTCIITTQHHHMPHALTICIFSLPYYFVIQYSIYME